MEEAEIALLDAPLPPDKPIEQWSLPELLNENTRQGLIQNLAIIKQPMKLKRSEDDELTKEDIAVQRVVANACQIAPRLMAQIQSAAMRRSSSGGMDEILAKIAQERQKAEQKQRSENKPTKMVDDGPA